MARDANTYRVNKTPAQRKATRKLPAPVHMLDRATLRSLERSFARKAAGRWA